MSRGRAAAAGAVATLVWAAVEPLDRRLFRHDYSDVAVLGKAVTGSSHWRAAGIGLHMLNGAAFGVAYAELNRRRRVSGVQLALAEHAALFPLGHLVDRFHPSRGEAGVAKLFSARAFVQATGRHALFGAVLERLASDQATRRPRIPTRRQGPGGPGTTAIVPDRRCRRLPETCARPWNFWRVLFQSSPA